MSRYIKDMTLSRSEQETNEAINSYLTSEGFQKVDFEGEAVWKKGSGLMTAPQFIKIDISSGLAHIEAWLKWAILPGVFMGEVGLDGLLLGVPKMKLKSRVEKVEELIAGPG